MRIVRRIYLYAVALVSLEVVVWGVIWLARTVFSAGLAGSSASLLAGGLSLTLVGLPVFLLHWLLAQRDAARSDVERTSRVRAVFLYAALLAHWIPAVHNGLSLANRLFLALFRLDYGLALIGPQQTWADNLVAILVNFAAGAYFLTVIRADQRTLPLSLVKTPASPGGLSRGTLPLVSTPGTLPENLAGLRRLQRYVWLLYSLGLVVLGVQQLLRFILYIPGAVGLRFGGLMAAGLALLLVGVPLWLWSSLRIEDLLHEPDEAASLLRLVVLYLLALLGVGAALGAAGVVLAALLRQALGAATPLGDLVNQVSVPLSIGIPLGVVWVYYGGRLTQELAHLPDTPHRAALRRLYFTILSALGLIATVIGLRLLLLYLIRVLLSTALTPDLLRGQLATALAAILAGLPLWILSWRPLQQEAAQSGPALGQNTQDFAPGQNTRDFALGQNTQDFALGQNTQDFAGDHARRSVIRKAYLYLVLFAGIIAMMVSAGEALYPLLRSLLGSRPPDLVMNSLSWLLTLILFTAFTGYHFTALRGDARLAGQALAARHGQFPVIVLNPGGIASPAGPDEVPGVLTRGASPTGREAESGFAAAFMEALHTQAPDIPVALIHLAQGIPAEGLSGARAVVLPAALATQPPEALRIWLDGFQGQKLVIPLPEPGWEWLGSGASRSDRRDRSASDPTAQRADRELAELAAQAVRQMAEGQPVRLSPTAPWMVVAYIFAILFALELLLAAIALIASRF